MPEGKELQRQQRDPNHSQQHWAVPFTFHSIIRNLCALLQQREKADSLWAKSPLTAICHKAKVIKQNHVRRWLLTGHPACLSWEEGVRKQAHAWQVILDFTALDAILH